MASDSPSLRALLPLWLKIGALGFGGPAGQIALLHREVVEQRKLIDNDRFRDALGLCTLLPGPEAQQLATWCGWRLHGIRGGIASGLLFILPGALIMQLLALLYVTLGHLPLVQGLFFGVKAAVVAIVLEALLRLGKKALLANWHRAVALFGFVSLYALHLPFPIIVALAAISGLSLVSRSAATSGKAEGRMDVRLLFIGSALWLGPTLLLLVFGGFSILSELALFFSQMAVVTFGGAYAVLAYVSQYAVDTAHWISKAQMLDGLGLAETTPGPLILVLQFVGFVAAYQKGGLMTGLAGSAITLWATFLPSFIMVLSLAPAMDRIRANRYLSSALQGIMAAAVGMMAALALGFAFHVLFDVVRDQHIGPGSLLLPVAGTLDLQAALLTFAACLLLLGRQASLFTVLGGCAMIGVVMRTAL